MSAPIRFADLLDPVGLDEFAANYEGKGHLRVEGPDDKFGEISSWEAINRLLGQSALWSNVVFSMANQGPKLKADEYCVAATDRDGMAVMRPHPEKIRQRLTEGATLILNHADTLTPEMTAVSAAMQAHFGAQMKCNIYCSWNEHQGFSTHFDGTDVFVLHIEGRKLWKLYDGFYELPLGGSAHTYHYDDPANATMQGNCIDEFELTPGDLLYIPRGQYHDALASSEASLHLTFGVVPAAGISAFDALQGALWDDPLFHEPLPHFDDSVALRAHLGTLGARLAEIFRNEEAGAVVRDQQKKAATREFFPAYDLPGFDELTTYRVRPASERAGAGGNALDAAMLGWVESRDVFTDGEFASGHAGLGEAERTAALKELVATGVVAPVL
jgi:hypothetical protein